jgi:uncharacterized membrane protein
MKRVIVGLFQDFAAAKAVVHDLETLGITADEISVITHWPDGRPTHHDVTGEKTETTRDAKTGAVVGGLAGLLLGLAPLVVPGIGPALVAGWLLTTLAGATFGAVTGGFAGALIDLGIPHQSAEQYTAEVVGGGTLVIARAYPELEPSVVALMERDGAVEVHETAMQAV